MENGTVDAAGKVIVKGPGVYAKITVKAAATTDYKQLPKQLQ